MLCLPLSTHNMSRWKRRAITWAIICLMLIYMYQKMVALGLSSHVMLLCYGGLAVISGLGQMVLKPNEKFAELMGRDTSMKSRVIGGSASLMIGTGLIVWAMLWPLNSN
jgi:hypothetical protein